MTTDQDLDVALALFNDGLERQKTERRAAKAIENAEKAKQQAAAALKRLQSDSAASAEDRAAAETTYREAVAAFNALRNGEAPAAGGEAIEGPGEPDDHADTTDAAADPSAEADPADDAATGTGTEPTATAD